jgi:N-methylhydantoinase A/oxoprolinase/acetone carboxylase beta subunit
VEEARVKRLEDLVEVVVNAFGGADALAAALLADALGVL